MLAATDAGAQERQYLSAGDDERRGIPDRSRASQDACQMAVDVYQVLSPQLGLALAGGNATLGRGGALGTGHFSIGLRGNVFNGDLPDVSAFPRRT